MRCCAKTATSRKEDCWNWQRGIARSKPDLGRTTRNSAQSAVGPRGNRSCSQILDSRIQLGSSNRSFGHEKSLICSEVIDSPNSTTVAHTCFEGGNAEVDIANLIAITHDPAGLTCHLRKEVAMLDTAFTSHPSGTGPMSESTKRVGRASKTGWGIEGKEAAPAALAFTGSKSTNHARKIAAPAAPAPAPSAGSARSCRRAHRGHRRWRAVRGGGSADFELRLRLRLSELRHHSACEIAIDSRNVREGHTAYRKRLSSIGSPIRGRFSQ